MEPKPIQNYRRELRDLTDCLKALADETRLSILTMLMEGEMCVCEIMGALPLSQPAVSHHLKVLRQAGLVKDRKEGKWTYYDLNLAGLKSINSRFNKTLMPLLHTQKGSGKRRPSPCKDC